MAPLLRLRWTGFDPVLPFEVSFACTCRRGKGAPGQAAALRLGGRRCAPTPLRCSVSWPRRSTHCVRCALSAQTDATSQSLMRAARAATSPALLGASEARCGLPGRAFADTLAVFAGNSKPRGLRGRRCPAGAISVATSSAGPGSARAQRALRQLTRRVCLSGESAANAVSSAARPRTEQRSAVDAQRRPPPHERPADSPCRDAPKPCKSGRSRTAATGPQADIQLHTDVSCVAEGAQRHGSLT